MLKWLLPLLFISTASQAECVNDYGKLTVDLYNKGYEKIIPFDLKNHIQYIMFINYDENIFVSYKITLDGNNMIFNICFVNKGFIDRSDGLNVK